MSGIYIHIPFCRKACVYCDFHFSTSLANKNDFVKALLKESELRKNYLRGEKVETIYFGGGTPSLLEENEMNAVLDNLWKNFVIEENAEITLEANPDDLTKEKLIQLKKSGINRLSIGLQSFLDEELKWMNRTHSAQQNIDCVKSAQDAGFSNITLDLIYGSKFQNEHTWEEALKTIETLRVQHLSCYNLTVEEKTAFGVNVAKKKEEDVNEELSAKQFDMLMNWSLQSGFEQYEISNFSKEGFYSRHNSSYWLGKNYLGLGPSAHSYNGASRQWNVSNNNIYISKINSGENCFEKEDLDEKTKLNEYLLTRLRTKWGIDMNFIEKNFSKNLHTILNKQIQTEKDAGNLFHNENQIILLTRTGKLICDEITRNLML